METKQLPIGNLFSFYNTFFPLNTLGGLGILRCTSETEHGQIYTETQIDCDKLVNLTYDRSK